MPSKNNISFHKKVRKENYNQLEKLFFFNNNQDRYYDKIVELIEKYGEPYIEKRGDFITIKLEKIETECLFASVGPKLIGVLVFKKNFISKSLTVFHIALDGKYCNKKNVNIIALMFEELIRQHKDGNFTKIKIFYIDKTINFE